MKLVCPPVRAIFRDARGLEPARAGAGNGRLDDKVERFGIAPIKSSSAPSPVASRTCSR